LGSLLLAYFQIGHIELGVVDGDGRPVAALADIIEKPKEKP